MLFGPQTCPVEVNPPLKQCRALLFHGHGDHQAMDCTVGLNAGVLLGTIHKTMVALLLPRGTNHACPCNVVAL